MKNDLCDLTHQGFVHKDKNAAEEIQTQLYEIGKKHKFEDLKDFFKLVYQVLLGQEQGPRLGSFIKLYGVEETIKIIDQKLQNLDNVN